MLHFGDHQPFLGNNDNLSYSITDVTPHLLTYVKVMANYPIPKINLPNIIDIYSLPVILLSILRLKKNSFSEILQNYFDQFHYPTLKCKNDNLLKELILKLKAINAVELN